MATPEDIPILPAKLPLPKFLLGDDLETKRLFVIHTEEPRFVAEVLDHGGSSTMLDPYWFNPDDELDNHALRGVMAEASEFYKRFRDQQTSDRN